eukprot:7274041-Lingulodinium_polyedra.AAC.1
MTGCLTGPQCLSCLLSRRCDAHADADVACQRVARGRAEQGQRLQGWFAQQRRRGRQARRWR